MIAVAAAGLSYSLADHPAASLPALILAIAGLVTALGGLATAIGGQVLPVIGHWLDAKREMRIAQESHDNLGGQLQEAVHRVTDLEKTISVNEKRIITNAELMREVIQSINKVDCTASGPMADQVAESYCMLKKILEFIDQKKIEEVERIAALARDNESPDGPGTVS